MDGVLARHARVPALHRLSFCPSIDQVYQGGIVPAMHANLPGDWMRCAICLAQLSEPAGENPLRTNHVAVLEMSCRHAFHAACLGVWLRDHTDCPMCRVPVNPMEIQQLVPYRSGVPPNPLITTDMIDNFLNAYMPTANYDIITVKIIIEQFERSLGLDKNALRPQRQMIKSRIKQYLGFE